MAKLKDKIINETARQLAEEENNLVRIACKNI